MATIADLDEQPSTRAEGSIASAFASLSNQSTDLPARFLQLKQDISRGNGNAILDGWHRLLDRVAADKLAHWDSHMIPEIKFSAIKSNGGHLPDHAKRALKECGTIIVRGMVSSEEALVWKQRIRDYASANPSTTGFPANNPQVYELYWSKSQLEARSHPNMLLTQTALNQVWSADPEDPVDTSVPITYCDRLRMRTPGDKSFNLGPHLDGGSLERWEDPEYRKCYSQILQGEWEKYDPFTVTHRLKATVDMYHGPGGCSAFRSYQGWLSLSDCSPGAGTLRVMPDLLASTAYTMLRPFVRQDTSGAWVFDQETSTFHGAAMGAGQELIADGHAHLYSKGFVSIPRVKPGDAVFWHCDVAHMVESEHRGTGDSSVLYIPAAPLCEVNSYYLKNQRKQFLQSRPPPDFPGGVGESQHKHRGTLNDLSDRGKRAMGCLKFEAAASASSGQQAASRIANTILGFDVE
ncbi:DUF1479-domain-containing protein [Aspergillus bertholletiae]|uniref:DUF1479-domain-containing protein n=1 Tax=Aspergillus bertholletiae TaxID=1226010 RepID=A0A5N7B4C8_9EURO|nr:DUF1479-domain-containing protein [Aspergillus bertholletiae]